MTVRRRYVPLAADDYDPSLPFGGKVVLAKKKKPENWIITIIEFAGFSFVVALLYYSYFHFDHLHFHVTHVYAQLGHAPAQHAMGHKFLNGAGIKRNNSEAFKWFRKAADQGHPHSAYNLAVGHMQGYDTDIKKGEAHDLIKFAAEQGVEEAHDVYHRVCLKGNCKH